MIGDWSDFRELEPRRLRTGLSPDSRLHHIFSHYEWRSSASRRSPRQAPWNREGWYIPYPKDWDEELYRAHRPVSFSTISDGTIGEFLLSNPSLSFWCFDVEKDEWYIGSSGDWYIPFGCKYLRVDEMRVVHDW